MNFAYLDTSSLVAISFAETGHEGSAKELRRFDRIFSSNLLEAEYLSVAAREERIGPFERHLEWISWVLPERPLTSEIEQVLAVAYLRGADLWHLACALYLRDRLGEVRFVTADQRQLAAARKLQLA